MLMPSGFMNSSLKISPGWIGSRSFVRLFTRASMVVDDFDVMRLAISPNEANSPLVVDPNTMLPGAVALEGLQAVAGRNSKIVQSPSRMEVHQFPPRDPLDRAEPQHSSIAK